jgi:hypothetical protein
LYILKVQCLNKLYAFSCRIQLKAKKKKAIGMTGAMEDNKTIRQGFYDVGLKYIEGPQLFQTFF